MVDGFSVVVPAHNRRSQLAFTLKALSGQTVSPDSFEVILVDDCSTDGTQQLVKDLQVPYELRYVRLGKRRWQGAARNHGVSLARHENIIFCDSDMLVLPRFIEAFSDRVSNNPRQIISGTPDCFRQVYTNYFPEMQPHQKNALRQVLEKAGMDSDRILSAQSARPLFDPIRLDIPSKRVALLLSDRQLISAELREAFYDRVVAPWLLFITRCVSIKREFFTESGGFDERIFRGEDWELGYRLHRMSAQFEILGEEISYHQEHAHDRSARGSLCFAKVLIEKFGDEEPELRLLAEIDSSDQLWRLIPDYKRQLRKLSSIPQNLQPEDFAGLGSSKLQRDSSS